MARQLVTARIIVDTDDWMEAEALVWDLIHDGNMRDDGVKWEETLEEDDPNMNDDDGNDHTEFD